MLIRNLIVLEHATQFAAVIRHLSRFYCIVRWSIIIINIIFMITFALKMSLGIFARRCRVATVRSLFALINIETGIVLHLITRFAFAIKPN
jgi:hypothetical protein